jgi:hypothetical protein
VIDIYVDGWTQAIFDKDERDAVQLTMCYTFDDRHCA